MKEIDIKSNEQISIGFEQEEISRTIRNLKSGKAEEGESWKN